MRCAVSPLQLRMFNVTDENSTQKTAVNWRNCLPSGNCDETKNVGRSTGTRWWGQLLIISVYNTHSLKSQQIAETKDQMFFGCNFTHPKRAKSLSSRMQLRGLFVEKHLGFGTWWLLWSHNNSGFLSNVVVEQFAVGRDGQLTLHSLVVVDAGRPIWCR